MQPKVDKRIVKALKPTTNWVSGVTGSGGKVDLVLGEFPTYQDSSHCLVPWNESHPNDLRLSREQEVKLADREALP